MPEPPPTAASGHARLYLPLLPVVASRVGGPGARQRPLNPSTSPSRCGVSASSAIPAREDKPVPSAATSTVPNVASSITFTVNLLSGWIAGVATAILPAQADASAHPQHRPPSPATPDECGLDRPKRIATEHLAVRWAAGACQVV
jgi:hypothetical protein